MLIYNYQKEFLGIDEKDLKTLGFQDLASLRTEVTDFADLFVKTPGYIHNFKHVHWIDFITCAESNEESKVIINVNNKNFKCIVQITSAFLVDNPSSKAYLIALNNLRELSHKESERIAGDIIERQVPQVSAVAKPIFNTPELNGEFEEKEPQVPVEVETPTLTVDPYETPLEIDINEPTESLSVDTYDNQLEETNLSLDINMDDDFEETSQVIDDLSTPLDIEFEDTLEIEEHPIHEPTTTTELVSENFDNGYTYDPTVASDELGLPLDLIEEFIQDFIEQAKEFKDELYQALEENDLDRLKILSHKLKGVAANLRIEDALETLSIVNTSSDLNIIRENLGTLYKIISKLAGEEVKVEREIEVATPVILDTPEIEDDLLSLDFKDEEDDLYSDPIEIEDAQVPQKIEIPELADDTFIQEEEIEIDLNLDDEISLNIDEKLELEEEFVLEVQETEERLEITNKIEYSKDSVASEIGLDRESFDELFNDYIEEAKSSVTVIQNAVLNGDLTLCKNEAIKFKGMSDNMRINTFTNELEILIHSSDESEITQAVDKINTSIAQLSNIGD